MKVHCHSPQAWEAFYVSTLVVDGTSKMGMGVEGATGASGALVEESLVEGGALVATSAPWHLGRCLNPCLEAEAVTYNWDLSFEMGVSLLLPLVVCSYLFYLLVFLAELFLQFGDGGSSNGKLCLSFPHLYKLLSRLPC